MNLPGLAVVHLCNQAAIGLAMFSGTAREQPLRLRFLRASHSHQKISAVHLPLRRGA